MKTPEFLFADNTAVDTVFIVHTVFPRFVLNVKDDEMEIWDEIPEEDLSQVQAELVALTQRALAFYDREIDDIDQGTAESED